MDANTGLGDDGQVVGLDLAGESYGVDIGRIQEIIRLQPVTKVPNAPACIEGVTNLRGKVIPVLDLRKRFGLPTTVGTKRSRIVVAELGRHTVGLVVDGVSEVLTVPEVAIEPPSAVVLSVDSAYLRGIAKLQERLVLLLDLSCLLSAGEDAAAVAT